MPPAMDASKALELGKAALAVTLDNMKIGASNQLSNPLRWADIQEKNGSKVPSFTREQGSYAYQCVNGMRAIRKEIVEADPKMTEVQKELFRAFLSGQTRCGNCAEHAAMAFSWLYVNGHFPVEVLEVTGGDHAFCVLNREAATNPATPEQWNEAAVYIDPWRKLVSMGRKMPAVNTRDFGGFGTKYHFAIKTRAEGPEDGAMGKAIGKTWTAAGRLR